MNLFERHPTPWKVEGPSFDAFFVRDARGGTVVVVNAVDETSTTATNDQGHMATTTIKTARPGAARLASMIVALPDLMAAIADAHAALGRPPRAEDANLAAHLESFIEKLA